MKSKITNYSTNLESIMKKLLLLSLAVVFILASATTKALTPFWYSWYAIDNTGQLLPNESTTLNVRIKIIQGSTIVYQELHSGMSSDQFAIFSVNVGNGSVESGTLGSITTTAATRIQAEVQKQTGPFVFVNSVGLASVQVNNNVLPGDINLAQDKILIGNSAGEAEAQSIGGDLTGTNTGSLASLIINDNAVTTSKIQNTAVTEGKIATGAVTESKIGTGAVTETKIGTGAVTNTKISNSTEFVNVQNAAGTSQFSVDNADRGLRFEGTGDVTVSFVPADNKVVVDFALPPLAPDVSGEPFLVYSAPSILSNAKIVVAGEAIGFVPGPSDYTYNVLYDDITIGINANKLYLKDDAVTATKIKNDAATGDKLIQVINNAATEIIDAVVLPSEIVYIDTAPATGDIDGNYENGLMIVDGAVTYAKLQDASASGLVLVSNASNKWVESSLAALETDPIWTAAEPNYGHLGQNETITGNWVNTANPWADDEVADNLTIVGGTVNNTPIGAALASTGAFTTLAASSTVTFSGLTASAQPNVLVVDNAGVVYKSPNSGSFTNIIEVSTNYTAQLTDGTILVDCAAGHVTISLPTAAAGNKGLKLQIKKIDSTVNSLIIAPVSGTIDGQANRTTIVPNQGFVVQSSGTKWFVVGTF